MCCLRKKKVYHTSSFLSRPNFRIKTPQPCDCGQHPSRLRGRSTALDVTFVRANCTRGKSTTRTGICQIPSQTKEPQLRAAADILARKTNSDELLDAASLTSVVRMALAHRRRRNQLHDPDKSLSHSPGFVKAENRRYRLAPYQSRASDHGLMP